MHAQKSLHTGVSVWLCVHIVCEHVGVHVCVSLCILVLLYWESKVARVESAEGQAMFWGFGHLSWRYKGAMSEFKQGVDRITFLFRKTLFWSVWPGYKCTWRIPPCLGYEDACPPFHPAQYLRADQTWKLLVKLSSSTEVKEWVSSASASCPAQILNCSCPTNVGLISLAWGQNIHPVVLMWALKEKGNMD